MGDQYVCDIKFFIYLNFLAGYYYNFNTSRWLRYLAIFYCIALNIGVLNCVYISYMEEALDDFMVSLCLSIEYLAYSIISLHRNKLLLRYYKKNGLVDEISNPSYKTLRLFLISCTCLLSFYAIVVRFLIPLPFLKTYNIPEACFVLKAVTNFFVLLGRLSPIFFFALLYCRMRNLRTKMESTNFNTKSIDKHHPRHYIQLYENIMDDFEASGDILTAQLILYVMMFIPYVYINFMLLLVFTRENYQHVLYTTWIFVNAIFMGLPFTICTIISDLIYEEVQKVLICIMEKRIESENERDRAEIQKLFEYIRSRPFNYKVWRTVPLNLRSLLTFVSFTLTTIIAITQIKGFVINPKINRNI